MRRPAVAPGAVAPARASARCRQCGEHAWVNVVRRGRRRIRYWCQRCGAVVTAGVGELFLPREPAPAEVPGADAAALREVMPAAMREWLAARSHRDLDGAALDKSIMYQLYQAWDRHRAGTGGDRLPPFATVVGALHDGAYRRDAALAILAAGPGGIGGPGAGDGGPALRERVRHARAWLASHPSMCWIRPDAGQESLVEPDRAAVAAAAAALRSGGEPGQVEAWAARAALFGVDGGPTLRKLRGAYPLDQVLAALDAYLDSGDRPLRRRSLAALAGTGEQTAAPLEVAR
jgi:hypothetical protein